MIVDSSQPGASEVGKRQLAFAAARLQAQDTPAVLGLL